VVATDWSSAVIEEMQDVPRPSHVHFCWADVRTLPRTVFADESFDVAIAKAGLDAMFGQEEDVGITRALCEVHRVLKPQARLLLVSGFDKKMQDSFALLPDGVHFEKVESFSQHGKGDQIVYFHSFAKRISDPESSDGEACAQRLRVPRLRPSRWALDAQCCEPSVESATSTASNGRKTHRRLQMPRPDAELKTTEAGCSVESRIALDRLRALPARRSTSADRLACCGGLAAAASASRDGVEMPQVPLDEVTAVEGLRCGGQPPSAGFPLPRPRKRPLPDGFVGGPPDHVAPKPWSEGRQVLTREEFEQLKSARRRRRAKCAESKAPPRASRAPKIVDSLEARQARARAQEAKVRGARASGGAPAVEGCAWTPISRSASAAGRDTHISNDALDRVVAGCSVSQRSKQKVAVAKESTGLAAVQFLIDDCLDCVRQLKANKIILGGGAAPACADA